MIFVYVNPAYLEQIFVTQTHVLFDAFRACGATVHSDAAAQRDVVQTGDHAVVYGYPHPWVPLDRFLPDNRWLYVVDEASIDRRPYDQAVERMCRLKISNMVVTYPNMANIAWLHEEPTVKRIVVVPQCVPVIRHKVTKDICILVSGQLSPTVYPTRTRLAQELLAKLPHHVHVQPYPGCDNLHRPGSMSGEAYWHLLDRCKLGVVCRAGNRDRFVAKYVEFGASHVLPVGDCPSYMPKEMKRTMVNVEGMVAADIIAEVTRLLAAPDELNERTDTFTDQVAQRYIVRSNVQRAMQEMTAPDFQP